MSFGLDDLFSTDTLGGALSGGAMGFMMGGPAGAAAGALGGGALGAYGHSKRDDAANMQKANIDAAMQRMRLLQQQNYAQRMKDLDRALSMYQPVQNYLGQMATNPYGAPGSAGPPPGAPGNPANSLGALKMPPGMGKF
jgi:hypothetical protein